jgi:hypothetical protein
MIFQSMKTGGFSIQGACKQRILQYIVPGKLNLYVCICIGISLLYWYIRQYHFIGHFKFHDFSFQTVSPFNIIILQQDQHSLYQQLYLHGLNTFSIKNNSFEEVNYYFHEHDQIQSPILRNNLRVHRYHAQLEQSQITLV